GKSVQARLREGFVGVGSPRFAEDEGALTEEARERIATLEEEGKTVVAVVASNRLLGLVALRDGLREDAASGINRLADMGVRAIMLTGDNHRAANAVATELNLDF